jgi:hypothetical protein
MNTAAAADPLARPASGISLRLRLRFEEISLNLNLSLNLIPHTVLRSQLFAMAFVNNPGSTTLRSRRFFSL